MNSHPEYKTNCVKKRTMRRNFVVVPVGPKIYRRDRFDVYERYCRLMVIFFKPWRECSDIAPADGKWSVEFEELLSVLTENNIKIIKNMQQLHECKDMKDDHFSKRKKRTANASSETFTLWVSEKKQQNSKRKIRIEHEGFFHTRIKNM